MRILLTYDYELFFGEPTGTVEKCIIEPTNEIRKIAARHNVKMVFFVDVGYLKQLEQFKNVEAVQLEHQKVEAQIKQLVAEGHDCQLHIHPHWEDSSHDGQQWIMKTDRYKLDDFDDDSIYRIVSEYKKILERWTGKAVHTYRAGGWCLQPFSRMKKAFSDNGLKQDSTVFPGGKFTAGNYYYDYTPAPDESNWRFDNDLCQPTENGEFIEYPISSQFYSPLFFWRLFILGRLKPKHHKPMGDGYPMSSPGLRKKMLTKGMLLSASMDGYFVTKMSKVIRTNEQKRFTETVFLGHPKACTKFALNKLNTFITKTKVTHQFVTFSDLL